MLGLIWIQSVCHSNGIPKVIVLKKVDFENKQKKQKKTAKTADDKISRGGGKDLVLFYQFILQKIKISGLRNYIGCAELYTLAFPRTRRHSLASSHYPFTVLVRRLILD